MKSYIDGWYCRDGLDLVLLNKESNEKIMIALRDSYPSGLTAQEIAEKTDVPLKTVYSQLGELYREYCVLDDRDLKKGKSRGRPPLHEKTNNASQRRRATFYIENATNLFDIFDGKKNIQLPPGNVLYLEDFVNAWHKVVEKEEEEEVFASLMKFVERTFRRIVESADDTIKNIAPSQKNEFCCLHCGLNHESRDFIRAVLLYMIDQFEQSKEFIEFLKEKGLLTNDAYDNVVKKLNS